MNCLRASLARSLRCPLRQLHTSPRILGQHGLTNILSDENPPPVQVRSISPSGIQLADGLNLKSACIFLEGEVFLWNVPENLWQGWGVEHFKLFELVSPKPEILLLGTGERLSHPPPSITSYMNGLGIQVDAMDTRNACSYYNMLAEEGRRVAAAILPLKPYSWSKTIVPK